MLQYTSSVTSPYASMDILAMCLTQIQIYFMIVETYGWLSSFSWGAAHHHMAGGIPCPCFLLWQWLSPRAGVSISSVATVSFFEQNIVGHLRGWVTTETSVGFGCRVPGLPSGGPGLWRLLCVGLWGDNHWLVLCRNIPDSGGHWSWVAMCFNKHTESQTTANNAIETLSKAWLKTAHILVQCVRPGMIQESTAGTNTVTNAILRVSSAYWRVKAMKPEMLKRLILFSATVKSEICQHCVLPRWQRQLACSYLLVSSQRQVPSACLEDYSL